MSNIYEVTVKVFAEDINEVESCLVIKGLREIVMVRRLQ